MAQIHNSDVTKGLAKSAGIQIGRENVPNQLAEKIVPVMETNPDCSRKINIIRSTSNNSTTNSAIYTTPTNQDFYLTYVELSFIKDVAATATEFWIQFTKDGATQKILRTPCITLTAGTFCRQINLEYPVKIDRNSSISIFNDAAGAVFKMTGVIAGYIDETSLA